MIKKIFISLFVLLGFGLSFSSANYVNFGSPIEFYGDNFCNIGSDYSFNCSKSSYLLTNYDSGYYNSVSSLFWTDEGLGFYYKPNPYNLNPVTIQGVINTGFVLCQGDTSLILSGSTIITAVDSDRYCLDGFNEVYFSYSDLIDFLSLNSPRLVGNIYPGYYVGLHLVFDGYYFSLDLSDGLPRRYDSSSYILKDMGITGYNYSSLTYGSNVLRSPLGGSINGGSQEVSVITPYTGDLIKFNCTKSLALAWYRYNGYNDRMCYSSYGNTIDLYSSGVGAFSLTGIDIHSVWLDTAHYQRYGNYSSGNMSYQDWFKYWRKTYNVYKKNSTINNPFSGVPFAIFVHPL